VTVSTIATEITHSVKGSKACGILRCDGTAMSQNVPWLLKTAVPAYVERDRGFVGHPPRFGVGGRITCRRSSSCTRHNGASTNRIVRYAGISPSVRARVRKDLGRLARVNGSGSERTPARGLLRCQLSRSWIVGHERVLSEVRVPTVAAQTARGACVNDGQAGIIRIDDRAQG
jgi:hypothetical protein